MEGGVRILGKLLEYLNTLRPDYKKNTKKIETYNYQKLLELLVHHDNIQNNNISETYLVRNILSLRNKSVQDIMIPRVDVVAFEENSPMDDILQHMDKSGYSRFPVYKDNLDNVTGFIHVKDIIPILEKKNIVNLSSILRSVLFISPYMKLLDLLYDMKIKRIHMAMVVDEFGGVDGLITFEDVMEEIVGDIRDEYDKAPTDLIKIESVWSLEADGRINIDDLEEYTGKFTSDEEKEESNTLSGLIVSLIGYIPAKNELIQHPSGIDFKIIAVDPLKINKVMVNYEKLHTIAED